MQSWLRRKTSSSGGSSPLLGKDKKKEDKETANLTPLERLLRDSAKKSQPVQQDGDGKFFGLENFGNTCYANSILQALYFSEPFREEVVNYPQRAPLETIVNGADGKPRPTVKITPSASGSQSKQKNPASPETAKMTLRPEDKSSAEYKKKQALLKGPVIPMDYDNSQSYGMSESLFTSLKDFFEGIIANKNRMGVIRPSRLVDTLKKEIAGFNSGQHQDAHEFLNLLLNSVVDTVEANGKTNPAALNGSLNSTDDALAASSIDHSIASSPWVHNLFQGTLTSETVCLTCEKISQRDEPFIDLSVDIEQHSSITACLRHFSEEEMLSERNKFSCDNCGYTESQKRMKIKRLPKILALHLKRFKPVGSGDEWRLQKLFHRVVYPFYLRLFNTTEDEDPDKIYELYAVVVHIGAGPFQGHYVSVVKSEAGWMLFDDELVEPVKKEFVQNFFGDRPGQATAYVLFYQETTDEKIKAEQARTAPSHAPPKPSVASPISIQSPNPLSGLGLTSPMTNGNRKFANLSKPLEEEIEIGPRSTHANMRSPRLSNSGALSGAMSPLSDSGFTSTSASEERDETSPVQSPTQQAKIGLLGRMRRSSKSGKRSPFFGSLELPRESKSKENGALVELNDTSGEETPKAVPNGTFAHQMDMKSPHYPSVQSPRSTTAELDSPVTETSATTGAESEPPVSGTKKRLLSLRRKATEKSSLRKSSSRANVLSLRKDDKSTG